MIPGARPPARRQRLRLALVVAAVSAGVPLAGPTPRAWAEEPAAPGDTVVGELVQVWADPEDREQADEDLYGEPLTWIEPETGDAVRVPTDEVEDIPVRSTVEVTVGEEVEDAAAAEDGVAPAREVLAAEVVAPAAAPETPTVGPATTLTNEVTVAMVVPAGGVQDATTLTEVTDAIDGPVAQFWSDQSGGAVSVGVTASFDWGATVAPGLATTTASCSDHMQLWAEVAARVGFVEGPGKHLLLYVSGTPESAPGCSYGLAEVGAGTGSGGRLYVRDTATSLIAHELGHNFGLGHSNGRQCDTTVDTGTCRTTLYRDYYDVMGVSWGRLGSLHAAHAERLGVLPPERRQDVPSSAAGASYVLSPVSASTGLRALRLTTSSGASYWLEYRPPAGQDSWLGSASLNLPRLQSGVLLRRADGGTDADSVLLDGTPSGASRWGADLQSALPVNGPVPVAGGRFRITVLSTSPSEARVWIGTAGGLAPGAPAATPTGSLDVVTATGSSVSLAGWALDPETPADPLTLHVYVDGRGTAVRGGTVDRPDVGRAYPAAGGRQGYSFSASVTPGPHQVCVFAIDSVGRGNSLLGCRSVVATPRIPVGSLDVASGAGTRVTVKGWTFDPDTPTRPVPVHVYVDGRGTALTATGDRPDVGRAFPGVGNAHGYEFSVPAAPGPREVCVFAIDTDGIGNRLLGCRRVTVVARLPIGSLDVARVSGPTLSVAGWTYDPDTPVDPTAVQVSVDGTVHPVTADGPRPDVGRVVPGAGDAHGFAFSTTLSPGSHQVCVFAIDTAAAGSTSLGCRTVVV